MTDKDIRGHAAMLTAGVIWGLNSPIGKSVLSYGDGMISPLSLSLFRMVGASALFWIASLFVPREHVSPHDMLLLFFASLFAIVLNQGAFAYGLSLTSPVDASIISTTTPILTMVLAALFLKEPITDKKTGGVILGAAGALLLILGNRQGVAATAGNYSMWGNLLCIFAQVSYSVYLTVYRGLISRYSSITLMKWMFIYASVCFIPFSYRDVSATDFAAIPFEVWWKTGFIIVCATFLAYLLLPVAQKKLRPTIVSMYNYVQPIVGTALAVMLGMDSFGAVKGIAVGLVFLGVYIVIRSKSKAQLDAETKAKARERNIFRRISHYHPHRAKIHR